MISTSAEDRKNVTKGTPASPALAVAMPIRELTTISPEIKKAQVTQNYPNA